MNTNLRILNSQIVFSYKRNSEIRKKVFEYEDTLKSEFRTPFRLTNIPEELDPNLPRFETSSINDHSKLLVSQTRISLVTKYDKNFESDFSSVKTYLTERCNSLKGLAEKEEMEFVAFVVELGIYMDEKLINKFLRTHIGANAISDECLEFSLLYSKLYENNYYLNVKASKFTEQEIIINQSNEIQTSGTPKKGISIILDINSKPCFENKSGFNTSLFSDISEKIFTLITTKRLEDYLKGQL